MTCSPIDLDGRSGFKLALQEAGGRFFLYVAGFWHSGWSILDVTAPEHPELLRWLDGPPNTMTIQVQVADGTMITALEHPPPGLTIGDTAAKPQDGFLIWDVREPDRPQLLGQWVSGGTGTHRNFYNGGQWVYATSNLPGFEGQILAIVDIADPANPKTAGTWWHAGQHKAAGETSPSRTSASSPPARPYPQHGLSLHGGAYAVGDRAYCPWMRGRMVILDIADKHHPAHFSTLPVYPPPGSTIAVHSAVPLPGRDVVVINDEALREYCDERDRELPQAAQVIPYRPAIVVHQVPQCLVGCSETRVRRPEGADRQVHAGPRNPEPRSFQLSAAARNRDRPLA